MAGQDVLRALRGVIDPEVGVNIVDLGLVYGVEFHGRGVRVVMTMTTPACPMHAYISRQVRAAIMRRHGGVASVEVALVWEPAWSPEMISEEGRRELGWV